MQLSYRHLTVLTLVAFAILYVAEVNVNHLGVFVTQFYPHTPNLMLTIYRPAAEIYTRNEIEIDGSFPLPIPVLIHEARLSGPTLLLYNKVQQNRTMRC